jgi:hypothetical protein
MNVLYVLQARKENVFEMERVQYKESESAKKEEKRVCVFSMSKQLWGGNKDSFVRERERE